LDPGGVVLRVHQKIDRKIEVTTDEAKGMYAHLNEKITKKVVAALEAGI